MRNNELFLHTKNQGRSIYGLFLNQMCNIRVSTFTFSDKIVILPREVHHRGIFTLVHFFHKSSVKVHNPPMIIWFSFPASCGLFRNVSCPLVFFIRNLTGQDAQEFPLELLLQNKISVTYRSDFTILLWIRSSNNLVRPFSASLVPLELFSDCFGNAIFVFSLLKARVPSET